jgi:hypothetical protein
MKTAKGSFDFFLLFLLFASFHTKNLRLFPFFVTLTEMPTKSTLRKGQDLWKIAV